MIDGRRRNWWFWSIALAVPAVCGSGCSPVFGPEPMPVTRVTGRVKSGREPVKSGWIEFVPLDRTVGKLCSAKIHDDGSFTAERVAVGMNLIRLAHARLGSTNAERLFGRYNSPIRRVISEGSTEPVVIDVIDEALRYQLHSPDTPTSEPQESGAER